MMNWKPRTVSGEEHFWANYKGYRLHVKDTHGVGSFMIKRHGTIVKPWGSGSQVGGLDLAKKQAIAYVDILR
jgi:hypothetical protein